MISAIVAVADLEALPGVYLKVIDGLLGRLR